MTASYALYTASSKVLFSFKPTQRLVSSTYRIPAVLIDFLEMGVVMVTVCPALCCARNMVVLICYHMGGAAPFPWQPPYLRLSFPPTLVSDSLKAVQMKNSISRIVLSIHLIELSGTLDALRDRAAIL